MTQLMFVFLAVLAESRVHSHRKYEENSYPGIATCDTFMYSSIKNGKVVAKIPEGTIVSINWNQKGFFHCTYDIRSGFIPMSCIKVGNEANGVGDVIAAAARSKINCRYVSGGEGPSTFDCSGLVLYCYKQAGITGLPHSAAQLSNMGKYVQFDELQPGDVVSFYGGSHVGIYVGNNRFIHAPNSNSLVCEKEFTKYYRDNLYTARRLY